MKHFANTKRREVQFKICNWVMVQLRPHRQPSVPGVRTSYSKLAKCFYRPYQVLYQIGKVAYKLQLPEGSHIHSIFHYFVLKPFHQTSEEDCVPRALSSNDVENQPVISLLAILGTHQASESTDPKLRYQFNGQGCLLMTLHGKIGKNSRLSITLWTKCFWMAQGMIGRKTLQV